MAALGMSAGVAYGAAAAPRRASSSSARRAASARRATPVRVVAAAASTDYDTIIVGAGVSGLCTAFTLGRSAPGVRMLVTEARDYVGGNINTKSKDGYTWEEGPNSYQPGEAILTMACDAGLGDKILLAAGLTAHYITVVPLFILFPDLNLSP